MFQRHSFDQADARPCPTLLKNDLCAQLAPLDRYGPTGMSFALANGVRTLLGVWRRPRAPRDVCVRC